MMKKLVIINQCQYDGKDYNPGDILTQSETEVSFGGPWGWAQQDGNAEWQDNVVTDSELLAEAKTMKLAQIKTLLAETDYKCLKFVDGDLTEDEYSIVKESRSRLRCLYNVIEQSNSLEEINSINL